MSTDGYWEQSHELPFRPLQSEGTKKKMRREWVFWAHTDRSTCFSFRGNHAMFNHVDTSALPGNNQMLFMFIHNILHINGS